MNKTLVMTVLGPDRPGIVERVADLIREYGGSWRESRLAHLQDRFAGIVQLSLPEENRAEFSAAVEALAETDRLRCQISESEGAADVGELATLECVGQDRPGIVYALSDALHDFQANVESMDSRVESAPMSGESLFRATFKVRLPEDADLEALENRLSGIGGELMLDVEFDA